MPFRFCDVLDNEVLLKLVVDDGVKLQVLEIEVELELFVAYVGPTV